MRSEDALADVCASTGVVPPALWLDYLERTILWGKRLNLTSAMGSRGLAEVLFLDACHALKADWFASCRSLVDVGAGVGAPAIPCLIALPALTATLVEPRSRRATFLRAMVGTFGIEDRVVISEQRLEPTDPDVEGSPFDVAISRATFAPQTWRRTGALLAQEVWVFLAGQDAESVGRDPPLRRIDYRAPSTGAPRSLLAYRGIRPS